MHTKSNSRRRGLIAAGVVAASLAAVPTSASALGVALSTSGWNWTNPAPQGNTLTGLQFVGNTGFAYGSGGTILRTDDGGNTWSGLATGTGSLIYDIDLVDANTIIARVGGQQPCSLRISGDGGKTFTRVIIEGTESSCDVSMLSTDFVSAKDGYALMSDGRVLKTTDGGASFGQVTKVDGGKQVAFLDATTGFATTATTLKKTPDGGQTWSDVGPLPTGATRIRLLSATSIIAWGKDLYATSSDAGVTWTTHTLGGLDPLSVSCRSALQCAFYGGNQLALTADGAVTLTKATIGNDDVRTVGYGDGARLVAVGKRGVTYLSDNDGATFSRTSSDPVGEAITDIDVRGGGGPVGITGNGRIARLSGDAWTLLPTISTGALADADFVDDKLGFALGTNGNLQRTQNGGATWSRLDPGTPSASKFIVAFDTDTQVLLGSFGAFRSGADGVFEKVVSKPLSNFNPVGVDAKGNRAASWDARSKKGGIRFTKDAGKTWAAVKLPKGAKVVSAVAVIPNKGLLATIDGQLYRSASDKGQWTALPAAGAQLGGLEAAGGKEFLVIPKPSEWDEAIVLRSNDAGKTFAAQSLAGGGDEIDALAADGPGKAYASVSGGEAPALFSTATGGVRGTASTISLSRTKTKQKPGSKVAIAGTLSGAKGTEIVRVSWRKRGSASWQSAESGVGANGGSFSTQAKLGVGTYDVVAQWTGDSGRNGVGSTALTLKVAKK